MIHPLLNRRGNIFFYFGSWILPLGIHILSLRLILNFPWNITLADSFISMFIFSLFGLSLWFLTYGNRLEKSRLIDFLIRHLISLTVLLVIWIFVSEFISFLIFGSLKTLDLSALRGMKIIEGTMFYLVLITIFYLINYYQEIQEKRINEEKLLINLRETELRAIKSQINPHFLFNSLNSVSSLTVTDPEMARKTIISLSEYLRYSLKMNPDDLVSLKTEIENARRYLNIEKVRFGDKMQAEFELSDTCMDYNVPVLILQPLYENAVKHGVYESTETIRIITKIDCKEDFLHIEIRNGFDPDAMPRKGEGIGLSSVHTRLKLLYGIQGLLQTNKKENEFIVELNIPLNNENTGNDN